MRYAVCVSVFLPDPHLEEYIDKRIFFPSCLRPVICFDERPCQLIGDVLAPIPMEPGRVQRQDYHYKRNGTCCVMIAFEPLAGKRIVDVKERKTKKDYAKFMRKVEQAHPKAEKIILVQDNLNTHNPSSFY
ncbi:MAG: transposase, partial [candidate division Zixibacteria bacterium]|nr:transposase [candidate division Zixibacteria bacterium]